MIAEQRTTASISDGAHYLRFGRRGQEVPEKERVDWLSIRNLPTDQPDLAVKMMEHTAELKDERVGDPYYSMYVSFHPDDKPDRQMMEQAADHVLDRLGLKDHQSIIVAHKDTEIPHFHILVNRIDIETGKAWNPWRDKTITNEALREFERERGLHRVTNWKVEPEQQKELPSLPRKSQVDFVEELRERAVPADLAKVTSWAEFEDRLAAHGLVAQRSGRGLQVTDGERVAKISALHRKSSLKNLERRFGETWKEWAARSPETAYEPRTQRGRSRPDPKILERVERAAPVAKIYADNTAVKKMVKDLGEDAEVLQAQRQKLDTKRHELDRHIRSALDAVRPEHRPRVAQLQPTAPAGDADKQTKEPSRPGRQTSGRDEQTNQLTREDLRLMAQVEKTDVSILRSQIPQYRKSLREKAAANATPKGPTLEDFRRQVAQVIKEEQLQGKQRFIRGDDGVRQTAKAKVEPLPDLLHRRQLIEDRFKEVDRHYLRTSNFRAIIGRKEQDPPSPTKIYDATKGIPGKQLDTLNPSLKADTQKVRSSAVQIWNATTRHIANQGAELILPNSLKPFARVALAKDKGRSIRSQIRSAAIKKLPKSARPMAHLATGNARALASTVLGRLLPPQVQVAIKVTKIALNMVKVAAQAVEKTRNRDQGWER